MTASYLEAPFERHGRAAASGRLPRAAVWLMMATSFYVMVEPAPVDLMFCIACAAFFLARGLTAPALAAPLILMLSLYNFGGFASYLPVKDVPKTGMFVVVSCYMAVTAVFFCLYLQHDTARRFATFKNGYVFAGVLGSAIALAGYADIGGLASQFPQAFRAQGTFKDPNVLSTYLILPAVLLMQEVMAGVARFRLLRLVALAMLLACIFLAFSRGAWVNLLVSTLLMVLLTFVLSSSQALRARIAILSLIGAVLLAAGLAALVSIDSVGQMFADRATLAKDYDTGEFGRFGNQLNSIPMLLERPLGFGPLQFGAIFGLDPHNVYINAFASYGWLGGFSYMALIVSTFAVGLRGVLVDAPWRRQAIALYAVFAATALQGIQIDTDHWRHFYWVLGLVWGFSAASLSYLAGFARPGAGASPRISPSN